MKDIYDIVFVGNMSIDKKICFNGKYVEVLGGSAYNSYCATQLVDKKQKIKIFSNCENSRKNLAINLNDQNFPCNYFIINEKEGSCRSEIKSEIQFNKPFECNHLHISVRKGVDFESFIKGNIAYKTLSIDVMISSVQNYIKEIKKFADKIDFLFCNSQEFEILKNVEIKGLIIVTNESKPIRVIKKNNIDYYYVPHVNKIKSTTGAGDSFIGGFLSSYVKFQDLLKAIDSGIKCSQLCLKTYSNQDLKTKKLKKSRITFRLPEKIVLIGPSCAGKSFIRKKIAKELTMYSSYDDLEILQERVEFDNGTLPKQEFRFYKDSPLAAKKTLKYNDGTFKIIDESLWKEVIEILCKRCSKYAIIEFSRGTTNELSKTRNSVYLEYLNFISTYFQEDKISVIFVNKSFKTRLKRNVLREKSGGHKVDLETFKTYYKNPCKPFQYKNVIYIHSNIKLNKLLKKIGEKL